MDIPLKNWKLIIRADANHSIGIGHVMRCLALAQAWTKHGGKALLVGKIESTALKDRLCAFNIEFIELEESYPQSANDSKILLNIAANVGKPSWIVLDGYFLDTAYQNEILKRFHNTLVIDDYHHLDIYSATMILNQNFGSEKIEYRTTTKTTVLAGAKYALLRNEFREPNIIQKKQTAANQIKLLISLGGADTNNTSLLVLKALNILPNNLAITLIIGPENKHTQSLTQYADKSSHKIEILSNVSNMAELIAQNDIIISAGGSSCWEICCIGKPLVIIITADNQKMLSNELAKAGAAINLGENHEISEEYISKNIKKLILSPQKITKLSNKSKTIIDGHGVARVINAMTGTRGLQ
ncbi:UDP-2,4-diacetamido-2,4,6-trideoxy-beta-L-altropyranose hydrolase [Desulfovibrio sp. UCD-KL4C]|uniref:UDP-2,4-diacetamido-2,4, 6-trideoxy-beta-L-altropyranose hydrolase n=1 Tax=Desulfovibrio sp. UCD-KL4C TaxID=2578120 RepID=UPI0025C237FA|nr:UDP-2,4-diacetamido-2,4,6-trideoxy-beta-L-altropyranose hydrolase [Desulfovibrio sp. UCD-KL4C]